MLKKNNVIHAQIIERGNLFGHFDVRDSFVILIVAQCVFADIKLICGFHLAHSSVYPCGFQSDCQFISPPFQIVL
jgi:hypothetical protein